MKWMGWACSFVRVLRMFSNAAVSHCDYRYVRIDQTLRGNTVGYLCVNCGILKNVKILRGKKKFLEFPFLCTPAKFLRPFQAALQKPANLYSTKYRHFLKNFQKMDHFWGPPKMVHSGARAPTSHSHVRPRKKKINFFFSIKKILKKFFFSSIIFFFYFFFKYFFFWKKFSIKK
jgi:hypothetical protein